MPTRCPFSFSVCSLLLLAVLAAPALPAAEGAWPGAQWETATPDSVGLDAGKLAQARDYALSGGGSGYITRGGKLVMTWGDPRLRYDLKSSTKSFGSIALGLALKDGKLRLEDKAKQHHPALGAAPEASAQAEWLNAITIAHLAEQTAGFEKPGGSSKLLFQPGEYWAYSDSGPNWLAECITLAYRRDVNDLMFERVFTPLGIGRDDLVWRKNSYRPAMIEGIARREFGAGISANVDALARIGTLMLREGEWNGREILSRDYARQSPCTPAGHEKLRTFAGDPHGSAAPHYGLLWWNNNDGTLKDVPRDAYWSWGLYDSFILVIPSLDIVATRAGKSWKRKEGAGQYEVLKPFFVPIVQAVRTEAQTAQPAKTAKTAAIIPIHDPLRVHPANPRYFADGAGRAVLLTGSHTWNNLVDMGPTDPPAQFDYDAYLDWMAAYPHNFFRLWAWELVSWSTSANSEKKAQEHFVTPHPWLRTGPGMALDGKPKFNLEKFNPAYFERLHQRVEAAGKRGIYAAIMLFEGWGVQFVKTGWDGHPFNPKNNVNGIDGDKNGDGVGMEIHERLDPKVTAIQEAYVRKVIDTVNDLDNVLYEISNENHTSSTQWQYQMIEMVKGYEKSKPKQHPVGMTFQYKGGKNQTLFESAADWISPNPDGGYRDNPPAAKGDKVIVTDTDHLWGIGGNTAWVWKSFLRGLNPIFMDPYDDKILNRSADSKWTEAVRKSMGQALTWSRRIDLAAMPPRAELASTQYCLANPGREYLIYLPDGKEATADLSGGAREYSVEWFNLESGKSVKGKQVKGGGSVRFSAPFKAKEALLYLKRMDNAN